MSLDYDNHDNYYAEFMTQNQLSPLIAAYLASAYAYYHLDTPVFSDSFFDQMARALLENYDAIRHPHRDLITRADLEAGTLLLSVEKYPSRAVHMSKFLIGQLKFSTRQHSSIFVCPVCGRLYSCCGWAEQERIAITVPMSCCGAECSEYLANYLRGLDEGHEHRKKLGSGHGNYLFTAVPAKYVADNGKIDMERFHGRDVLFMGDDIPTVGFIGHIPRERQYEMRVLALQHFQAPFSGFLGLRRK